MDQPARPQSSGPWRLAIAPGSVLTVGSAPCAPRTAARSVGRPGNQYEHAVNDPAQRRHSPAPRHARDCPLSVEGLELILGDAVVVRLQEGAEKDPFWRNCHKSPWRRDAPRVGGGSLPPVPSRSRHRRRRPGRLAPARPGRPPEPGFSFRGPPRPSWAWPAWIRGRFCARQGRLEGEGGKPRP